MSGLSGLDPFFEPLPSRRSFSKKQIRRMSKKQLRRALLNPIQGQSSQRQGQFSQRQSGGDGLALGELIKSKEFKERVAILKEGGRLTAKGTKIVFAKGRIAATKLVSRIRKARRKSIYD